MRLLEIKVGAFRNLAGLRVQPHAHFNLVWGLNGQGKTNFLEAIYLALRGKSFRPYATRNDWLPLGSSPLDVELSLEDARGFQSRVRLHAAPGAGGTLRTFLDEKRKPFSELQERYPVVAFSPDDDYLIRGGPDERRAYIDLLYSDICPGYGAVLQRYEHVLKSRNAVLRSLRDEEDPQGRRREELSTWTQLLVKSALELAQLRADLWPQFLQRFLAWAESPAAANLGASAQFDSDLERREALEGNALLKILRDGELVDVATGWTHRGPHRDDLKLFVNQNMEARTQASQGQARLLALGLKWLHTQWIRDDRHEEPLLLVDDFSSELDSVRRTQIISLISSTYAQIFVSATEANLVDSLGKVEYTNYHIQNGQITF